MRFRNVKNKEEIISQSKSFIEDPKKYKGKWQEVFNNKNKKLYIEVGMGKGKFIVEHAKRYKDINFIGIERFDSVLARALEKVEEPLPNLYMIRLDAKEIDEVFDKEIDRIYLNFSDPWPKNRHEKRRLTSHVFLEKYSKVFKKENVIYFRTDNRKLFEYSLESLSTFGYVLKDISLNLHKEEIEDLITTEYEEKFSSKGSRIYEVKAYKKDSNL